MPTIKRQGTTFEEETYGEGGSPAESELDEIMRDETELPSKFPIDKKKLIFIAGGTVIAAALVVAAVIFLKPVFFPEEVVEEIPVDEPWGDYEEEIPPPFAYSAQEADKLRAAGYTAGEIEDFEFQEITDIQPLIDKQLKARQDVFLDMYRAFLREAKESGNEQYNYVLSNSYLGLPPQEFAVEDEKRDYVTYTENVDYWKMPLQGWQPTIKIRLENDAVVFMHLTPVRYEELPDSGNMNIRYDYIYYRGVKCVTNLTEVVQ